ncbi:MAG: SRPBCC domain-containing protein [Thermomicrobiales bacterium]
MDDALAPVWKALADPTRRRLLDLLREQPQTTGALAAAFPALSRFAVMKHLGVLEAAGLVVARKRGREVWHYLNAVPLQRIYERWVGAYQGQWASSLLGIEQIAAQGRIPAQEGMRMETVQIEQEIQIGAEPQRVFAALIDPDGWWRLRYTDLPQGITFEPRIGGRFYQGDEGDGRGSLWATVTHIEPGKKLTLNGTMAMQNAVAGIVNFDLEPQAGGTLLKLQHYAIGPIDETTRANYTSGWQMLLGDALKSYVERDVRFAAIK